MAAKIHDSGYKKLFSNRTIFRQLIETFVQEDWVKEIDFDQSETLDKSFVSDHYKSTESDLIHKVKFRGREAYLVILLEFQSTVERFMALRVLNYLTNFYMDDVASAREKKKTLERLPPLFPIVLYNGQNPWTAPLRLQTLIQDVKLLGKYAPRFQYCKIEEHAYAPDVLLKIRNIVSTVFLAELNYDPQKLREELKAVFRQEHDRRAVSLLYNWLMQLWRHGKLPSEDFYEYKEEYENAEEADSMLIETITLEKQHERQEGLFEGLMQGIESLVKNKFGEAATSLVQEISELHNVKAMQETLDAIVQAATLEQVKDFVLAKKKSLHN